MSYEDKSGKETKKVNAEKQTKWKTRRECRSFIIEKGRESLYDSNYEKNDWCYSYIIGENHERIMHDM